MLLLPLPQHTNPCSGCRICVLYTSVQAFAVVTAYSICIVSKGENLRVGCGSGFHKEKPPLSLVSHSLLRSLMISRNPFEPNCLFLEPFAEKLGISSLVLILGRIPGILCSLRDQWPPFHRSHPTPHISLHHIPAAHTVPIYLHWLKVQSTST
jgi:hypothetical protein